MKNKCKVIDKVVDLLEQAKMPRWLHHFGPKKYGLWQHAVALLIKQECKLSYRRVSKLLNGLGHTVPTYSALCKMSKRIPLAIWKTLLATTVRPTKPLIAAIDATFYSTTNPSFHYLRRTGRKPPKTAIQLTALRDICSNKWLGIKIHRKQSGEAPDTIPLLQHAPKPHVLVADKAYDAEYIHEYAYDHNILTVIPSKKRTKKGFYRRQMKRRYNERLYHRRSLIESAFSSTKRRSGSYVLCKKARTQKAELYARYIADNLLLTAFIEIFNRAGSGKSFFILFRGKELL